MSSMKHLERAAEFLQKAKVKHREFENLNASIPEVDLLHWKEIHQATIKSIGIGTAGIAGGAGAATLTAAGLYRAAGLFGVASTGTPISGLTGAAAHSARMAWLGGGAVSAGGEEWQQARPPSLLQPVWRPYPSRSVPPAGGQWKAHQLKGKVEESLSEFAKAETRMHHQTAIMNAGMRRSAN